MPPEMTRQSESIARGDRGFLDQLFADDIRRTAERSGIVLKDWLDPEYRKPMRPDSVKRHNSARERHQPKASLQFPRFLGKTRGC